MKKILTLLLAAVCLIGLVSCKKEVVEIEEYVEPIVDVLPVSSYYSDLETAVRDILRYSDDSEISDVTNAINSLIPSHLTPDAYPMTIDDLHIVIPTDEDVASDTSRNVGNTYIVQKSFSCQPYFIEVKLTFSNTAGAVTTPAIEEPVVTVEPVTAAVYVTDADGNMTTIDVTTKLMGVTGGYVYGQDATLKQTEDGYERVSSLTESSLEVWNNLTTLEEGGSLRIGFTSQVPITGEGVTEEDGIYFWDILNQSVATSDEEESE